MQQIWHETYKPDEEEEVGRDWEREREREEEEKQEVEVEEETEWKLVYLFN